ncbi:MAG: hypothetical protein PHU25_12560 [Deltaproteobacteria bacterium]|nr:hypothetical protein [Deltaproteobacteria bacterium]
MHLADIIGIGRTAAGEHWRRSLVDLCVEAGGAALDEARGTTPTAVIVGNALGGVLGDQQNLALYAASRLGLERVETHTVADDEASGGSAVRVALALLAAGLHERVLVIGAEKTTDALPDGVEAARAKGLDAVREAGFGMGPSVGAALAMRRYIDEHRVDRDLFYHLAATAHAHAALNPLAFLSWPLPEEQYRCSPVVAEPFTVCDGAPLCDGAAAVVLARPSQRASSAIRIAGSSAVSCRPGIAGLAVDLSLPAAERSAAAALSQAGLAARDVSVFELHDSSTLMAALSVEAVGLAPRGKALDFAARGGLRIGGERPALTFGGLKARGHVMGAAGVCQIAEGALQLRGEAGTNQVAGAKSALVQCLGSLGATAVTHVLA